MARCYNQNQRYQKSALTIFNNATQTLNPNAAGGAIVVLGGNISTDTGCSIAGTTNGAQILCSGLYSFDVDITFTLNAGPGAVTFQLYKNGVPLPCAQATISTLAADTESVSFGTTICVNTCAASQPTFTVVATSTTATDISVTHAKLEVIKDA